MNPILWLLVGGAGLAGISFLIKSQKVRSLPRVSNAEFVSHYRTRFADADEAVLNQRIVIASHLGLPAEVLSPSDTFERLSRYTGFVGEYEVGMGDLETELLELVEQAGLEPPHSFPETVGELIHEMLRASQQQRLRD